MKTVLSSIGAVAIGRNEGARLVRCLQSLQTQVSCMVYVDSGSSDDSLTAALEAGAEVVELDLNTPFTAARARNAGLARLRQIMPEVDYVQFIDGDCELQPGWVQAAYDFLATNPDAAVACGRRRERFPDASLYNRLIDQEWDTQVGQAKACGGDALMKVAALEEVGGFNDGLIAGEEPELCVRLRQVGWSIHRLDQEMTLHDAALTRFRQWWQRARRAGHAYGEGAAMHGAAPERHKVAETRRAVLWGLILPLAILGGLVFAPYLVVLAVLWPVQLLRQVLRGASWSEALFLMLGKFPEAQGVLDYWFRRLTRRRAHLIEYK